MGAISVVLDRSHAERLSNERMQNLMNLVNHRGVKDSIQVHTDERKGIGLGIISHEDAPRGAPSLPAICWNESRSVAVIMTGVLLNAQEIKGVLQKNGVSFESSSDEAVILRAYELWGTMFLHYLEGMFSIAVIDFRFDQVLLARDQFGKKPLYYYRSDEWFVACSELQVITQGIPGPGNWNCDYAGLSDYLVFGHNIRERTLLKDVKRVLPGEAILVSFSGDLIQKWKFWQLPAVNPFFNGNRDEAYHAFKVRLENAITRNLDHPDYQVDLLLSGGIDSTALLCGSVDLGFLPTAYTLFTPGHELDGTENVKILTDAYRLNAESFQLDELPNAQAYIRAMNWFDEPFCCPNALGLNLACEQLAKAGRRVAMVGDGGNELMIGFNHFQDYAAGRNGQQYQFNSNDSFFTQANLQNMPFAWASYFTEKQARTPSDLRQLLFAENFNRYNDATLNIITQTMAEQQGRSHYDFLARFDYLFEVPDEIMTRLDRMSSHWGIQLRSPMVDRDLTAFMISLPEEYHIGHGLDIKWMINRYIVESTQGAPWVNRIINRRRQGFPLPMNCVSKELWDSGMAQWVLEDDFLWWTSIRREGVIELMNKKYNKNGVSRSVLTLFSLYLWWRKVICCNPIKLN